MVVEPKFSTSNSSTYFPLLEGSEPSSSLGRTDDSVVSTQGDATADNTFIIPAPCFITGYSTPFLSLRGVDVHIKSELISSTFCLGERSGNFSFTYCLTIAAAPATAGVDIEVPLIEA